MARRPVVKSIGAISKGTDTADFEGLVDLKIEFCNLDQLFEFTIALVSAIGQRGWFGEVHFRWTWASGEGDTCLLVFSRCALCLCSCMQARSSSRCFGIGKPSFEDDSIGENGTLWSSLLLKRLAFSLIVRHLSSMIFSIRLFKNVSNRSIKSLEFRTR